VTARQFLSELDPKAGWKLPLAATLVVGVTLALVVITIVGNLSIGFWP